MSQNKWSLLALVALAAVAGCNGMANQPKIEPLEANSFFANNQSALSPPEGTVARGQLHLDRHLYEGTVDGQPAETFPFEITMADMQRGRERFDIHCAPCHGRVGTGEGMVVKRGFPAPPTFHSERLRAAAPGYYFDVITNGFGRMYDYSAQITAEDRWRIIAYIRALQVSQNANPPAPAKPQDDAAEPDADQAEPADDDAERTDDSPQPSANS